MFFSYQKLLDYGGNRYALACACMAYARKVKYLAADDYQKVNGKDALVALKHVLDKDVLFTTEKNDIEMELGEDSIIFSQKKIENKEEPNNDEEISEKDLSDIITRKE